MYFNISDLQHRKYNDFSHFLQIQYNSEKMLNFFLQTNKIQEHLKLFELNEGYILPTIIPKGSDAPEFCLMTYFKYNWNAGPLNPLN
jgi:hypothetical protein